MKLSLAIFVYLLIGAFLGAGILMAVKGSFWLLLLGALSYVIGFAVIGCLNH